MAAAVERTGEDHGFTCPECSRRVARVRGLMSTRRRWRWAACSILVLALAIAAGGYGCTRSPGWASRLPTPVLIALMPVANATTDPYRPGWGHEIEQGLVARFGLTAENEQFLQERHAPTRYSASLNEIKRKQMSDTWRASLESVCMTWRDKATVQWNSDLCTRVLDALDARGQLSGAHRRTILDECAREVFGQVRKWPRNQQIVMVPVEVRWFMGSKEPRELRFVRDDGKLLAARRLGPRMQMRGCGIGPDPFYEPIRLGTPAQAEYITLELWEATGSPRVPLWTSRVRVVEPVDSIEQAVKPVGSPAIDAALAAGSGLRIRPARNGWTDSQTAAKRHTVEFWCEPVPEVEPCIVPMLVVFSRDQKPVAWSHVLARGGFRQADGFSDGEGELEGDAESLLHADLTDCSWSVDAVSEPDRALLAIHGPSVTEWFWKGRFKIKTERIEISTQEPNGNPQPPPWKLPGSAGGN